MQTARLPASRLRVLLANRSQAMQESIQRSTRRRLTLEQIARRFDRARKVGKQWEARCPIHDDNRASLSIGEGRDGRILIHCHTKICETVDILAEVGLTIGDLMPDDPVQQKRRMVAAYDYCDADGVLRYQALRYEPKDFRQRRPDGNGDWLWNLQGTERILYNLPALMAAEGEQTLVVLEGEKDCDRLAALGILTTCNVGGAGKWRDEYSKTIANRFRRVVIVPDNDPAGEKHADEVAASLSKLGVDVRVLRLPSLPPKGDASDWLDSGGDSAALIEMIDDAPEWSTLSPPALSISAGSSASEGQGTSVKSRFRSRSLEYAENRTEESNARRFVQLHGHRVRYVPKWNSWLVNDGRRWKVDATCEVERLAKDVSDAVWSETKELLPRLDRAAMAHLVRFATETASARGQVNLLKLARSAEGIAIEPNQLDSNPWLLNVENGTLDLKTGTLQPHDPADFITKLAPVRFIESADCPGWRKFTSEIMAGDPELTAFLRKLCGYWCTGIVRDHVLPICYGTGANGKSVFLNTIMAMLGDDYAMKAPGDLLLSKKHDAHPTERADLFGKRLVVCIETNAGKRLDESLVKELTGGDSIRARRMREDFWQFDPTHKLAIASNCKPAVHGTDNGIWRRLRLVPFTVTIPAKQQDQELPERFLGELPGILNWALLGCMEWQAEGLGEPTAVMAATESYRAESDPLGDFLSECCVVAPHAKVRGGDLYAAYKTWCERTAADPDNNTVFGRKMNERGFHVEHTRGGKVRTGLGLTSNSSKHGDQL
jgi:putative DNA primase/helicase